MRYNFFSYFKHYSFKVQRNHFSNFFPFLLAHFTAFQWWKYSADDVSSILSRAGQSRVSRLTIRNELPKKYDNQLIFSEPFT